ncbi:hypothetical protein HBI56_073950 [Parastagonospora nodorum]|uniref:Uncharacterized protein n=1 Tax=Phaeosphaeria nodorum (strain SN15 / ATCC MYA-4574 / FGSC 10173) TaxID=321614 RepID=A0A7U2EXE0_PHANO|nr:hypothetical protein HBH56_171030 [Parastagonospora nodorum]QRC94492.1 hypothetical protein JI435_405890 [Parastagonospora nodorum SN15]KAH3928638.1 hypothetical protein HBH54_139590 [Parastagonospora nodorum]KAH3985827.1 hypothetical protein HBH51_018180 [Parastagonospora nodorum]KAH4003354.1 hypothetical protein HBI10_057340 [Parastagonospora nodorum]
MSEVGGVETPRRRIWKAAAFVILPFPNTGLLYCVASSIVGKVIAINHSFTGTTLYASKCLFTSTIYPIPPQGLP